MRISDWSSDVCSAELRSLADIGPTIALGVLGIGIVLMFETAFGRGALFWPLVIGIVGVALIWRQADEAQRERWLDSSERINPLRALFGAGGWASYTRVDRKSTRLNSSH